MFRMNRIHLSRIFDSSAQLREKLWHYLVKVKEKLSPPMIFI